MMRTAVLDRALIGAVAPSPSTPMRLDPRNSIAADPERMWPWLAQRPRQLVDSRYSGTSVLRIISRSSGPSSWP